MSDVFHDDTTERHPTGWAKDAPGNLSHALETLGFKTVGLFEPTLHSASLEVVAIGVFGDSKGNIVLQTISLDGERSQLFYSGASPDPESQLAYLLERFGSPEVRIGLGQNADPDLHGC